MKKNGFTLVELLAVIVILGIVISIGALAVTRIINNTDKDNTITDGQKLLDAALLYYNEEGLNSAICISASELKTKGYYENENIEEGSVWINIDNAGKTTYKWLIIENGYYASQESGSTVYTNDNISSDDIIGAKYCDCDVDPQSQNSECQSR